MKRPPLFLVLLTLALALLPSCTPPGGGADAKPVIYLYPEAETDVTVTLDYDGELTCVYPVMNGNSWMVTASPDGTLTDAVGQTYNYLYWEGVSRTEYDFSQGFCVPGRDTAAFLEDTLATLGLNRREANEFIVYWLPHMEGNAYNLIAFQTSSYTDHARLTADPAPDTVLRVFMAWKPLDRSVELPPHCWGAPDAGRPGAYRLHPGGVGRRRDLINRIYTKEEFPCLTRLSSCWTSADSTISSLPAGSGSAASTAR